MRRAFTLIELLVVIAIISMLIAILLPMLSAARESALFAKCGVNLQQIGIGVTSYAMDRDEMLPPTAQGVNKPSNIRVVSGSLYYDIRQHMDGYVEFNLLQCPLAPNQVDLEAITTVTHVETNYMFYWNWRWIDQDTSSFKPKQLSLIGDRFTRKVGGREVEFDILAMDLDTINKGDLRTESSHPGKGTRAVTSQNISGNQNSLSRHDGKPRGPISKNYLHMDGSVETFGSVDYTHAGSKLLEVPTFKTGAGVGPGPWHTYLPEAK